MGRKAKDGVPGSIYSERGLLVVKVKGEKIYTGMEDSKVNRRACEIIKRELYNRIVGITPEKKAESASITTIAEAFEIYLSKHCASLRSKTISGYKNAYNAIVKSGKLLLTKENIDKLALGLSTRSDLSPVSINIYLRAFRVFLRFCIEQQFVDYIDIGRYRQKVRKEPVKIYTEDEIVSLCEYFSERGKSGAYKRRNGGELVLFIRFLLATGARIGEALSMKKDDISDGKMFFGNKNTCELEYIPLSTAIREILSELNYLKTKDRLFTWSEKSYSRLNRRLNEAMTKCGIEKNGRGFHEFRKTFLHRLFSSGVSLKDAQRLMRHKTPSVTLNYYTFWDDSALLKELERAAG
jgi:integrase